VTEATSTIFEAFSLRRLVREHVETAGHLDPDRIAAEVLADLPRRYYERALRELLRGEVVHALGEARRDAMNAKPRPKPRPTSNRFQRHAEKFGDPWQRWLAAPIEVGDSFRRLSECTADDLDYAARRRRELAAANTAVALRFEAYRDAVRRHGVDTFGDLPVDVQLSLLVHPLRSPTP
jgi:chemotaxis regulatin CheY-phosphate phosphatase CheZ